MLLGHKCDGYGVDTGVAPGLGLTPPQVVADLPPPESSAEPLGVD